MSKHDGTCCGSSKGILDNKAIEHRTGGRELGRTNLSSRSRRQTSSTEAFAPASQSTCSAGFQKNYVPATSAWGRLPVAMSRVQEFGRCRCRASGEYFRRRLQEWGSGFEHRRCCWPHSVHVSSSYLITRSVCPLMCSQCNYLIN